MPQHKRTETGGIITYDSDDWTNGLAVGADFSSPQSIKTRGAAALKGVDPFRERGYLQPGVYPSSATNESELAGAVVATQIYSDGNTMYGVDSGGKVQKYTISTSTLTTSFHTITGTNPVGQDCIIYRHNSGGTAEANKVFSLFYSYYNNANWDVGAYINLVSPTFDDDFMSSVPATPLDITSSDGDDATQRTAPHPMEVGANDILYIGSGRFLHSYDGNSGTNGTFTRAVLTLPAGFIITGLLKEGESLLISGNYANSSSFTSSEALVYVWDYNELTPTRIIPLGDSNVHSIFKWRGVPCVITSGAESLRGINRIKQLVGNNAIKLTDIGSLGAPGFRGIDSSTSTLYMNCQGNIVTVGNPTSDSGFEVNNITSTGDGISTGVAGFVKILSTGVALASSRNTSTNKFVKFDATGYVTAEYRSMFYQPPFPPGYQGKVKKVAVQFKNTVTSQTNKNHIISLWKDYNSTDIILANQSVLAAPLTKQYILTSAGNALPLFTTIAPRMIWQNGSASWADSFVIDTLSIEYDDVALPANS